MRLIKHLLTLIFVVLPMQLVGIVVCLIGARYKMGLLPKYLHWFDDERATYCYRYGALDISFMVNNFGPEHYQLFMDYNSTYLKRYIWMAFRNPINVFQHEVLGKHPFSKDLWQINNPDFIIYGKYKLTVNIGYKMYSEQHREHMAAIGIPIQWVFSVGIRSV